MTQAIEPITRLLAEIQDFEADIFPPTEDPCLEHCKIVGDCPPELRPFYSFSRHCERELKQLAVDLEFSRDDDGSTAIRIGQLNKKQQVTRALLYYALREYFKAYGDNLVMDIGKDWQVFTYERGPDVPPIIRQIFGGR
jgi:hypothetical protein